MANAIPFLTLLLAALAALLAGMGVFGNSRPPDSRLGQALDDLDELKGMVNGLQKQLMQLERKVDKDAKDVRSDLKEQLDRVVERVERKLQDALA